MDHTDLEAVSTRMRRGYQREHPIQVHIDCASLLADLYRIRNLLDCSDGEHPVERAKEIAERRRSTRERWNQRRHALLCWEPNAIPAEIAEMLRQQDLSDDVALVVAVSCRDGDADERHPAEILGTGDLPWKEVGLLGYRKVWVRHHA